MSMGEDYERYTRRHYMDAAVADEYAVRQVSAFRAPAEWTVARLEIAKVRASLERLGAAAGASVLDVPAGTGKLQPMLSSRFGSYLAMDVSHAMIAHVPGTSPRVQADATKLPLQSQAVDYVVVLRLLHRVPRDVIEAVLDEALRVARVGAVVSYAGVASSGFAHSLIRVAGRRQTHSTSILSPDELVGLAAARDADVVSDDSISFGLTAERVAALRKRPVNRPTESLP